MPYKSWERVKPIIITQFTDNMESYNKIASYLQERYFSVEERLAQTFRFVSCHSSNRNVFSYEYASILRDVGSIFGSVMEAFVRETTSISEKIDIRDYRKWLEALDINDHGSPDKIAKIHDISATINYPGRLRVIIPFLPLKVEENRLDWWDAYNAVKHSDMEKFSNGNLINCLSGVASLAILLALSIESFEGKFFVQPGIFHTEDFRLQVQF
jgi:hypothetical protein